MSTVFNALADPARRHVVRLLREGPKSAGELAAHFPVSKPTMSAHFVVLREAGLVRSDKHSKAVIYRIRMSVLEEALMEFAHVLGLVCLTGGQRAPSRPCLERKGHESQRSEVAGMIVVGGAMLVTATCATWALFINRRTESSLTISGLRSATTSGVRPGS